MKRGRSVESSSPQQSKHSAARSASLVPLLPRLFFTATQNATCHGRYNGVLEFNVDVFATQQEAFDANTAFLKAAKEKNKRFEKSDSDEDEDIDWNTYFDSSVKAVTYDISSNKKLTLGNDDDDDDDDDDDELDEDGKPLPVEARDRDENLNESIETFQKLNSDAKLPVVLPKDLVNHICDMLRKSWGRCMWWGQLPPDADTSVVYAFVTCQLVATYDFMAVLRAGVIFAASDEQAITIARRRFVYSVTSGWRNGFSRIVADSHEYENSSNNLLPAEAPKEWNEETCDKMTAEWLGIAWNCCDDNMGECIQGGPAQMNLYRIDGLKTKTLVKSWPPNEENN